jgi:hypothetical protein
MSDTASSKCNVSGEISEIARESRINDVVHLLDRYRHLLLAQRLGIP